MSSAETIFKTLGKIGSDAASLAKTALLSRRPLKMKTVDPQKEIIIMGNGPSLRTAIDRSRGWLDAHELMAVNFAANAPEFAELRPERYILADPHFFEGLESDTNVARLWERLRGVTWTMTLHVPAMRLDEARRLTKGAPIRLATFNLTPLEGHKQMTHTLMERGLGMPRPRNVLIPAIMTAIGEGYGRIYLAGADHSWSRTLSVDDRNRVLSVQPHFYADNSKELDRVAAEYAGYHLHDILGSLTVAFRSYFEIRDFALRRGVEIFNATPGSFIDAFPRMTPPLDK